MPNRSIVKFKILAIDEELACAAAAPVVSANDVDREVVAIHPA